ncbi:MULTISPECIES: YceI family protein [Sphingobacterium]|uniref:YceI family protein n=1 Tax=Sphingobacterium TaxID=28453 RepID=UPI0013DC53FE|nr:MULTISPECIES: YceI family protein [unclassified Sphingobacterium]
MKKITILSVASTILFFSCQGPSGDKAATAETQEIAEQKGDTYTLDAANSTLKWTGFHKGGLNPRFGILKSEGILTAERNEVTGGTFTIDIHSLLTDSTSVDPAISGGKTSNDLDAHLKNEDFFDVGKYPTAKFEITKVVAFDRTTTSVVEGANNTISGNLTIKDKTVNVTFPAKITVDANGINIFSKFTINRQNWGLTYGTEGDAKDWMIAQNVDIELSADAKKK